MICYRINFPTTTSANPELSFLPNIKKNDIIQNWDNELMVDNSWHLKHYGFLLTLIEKKIFQYNVEAWNQFYQSKQKYCMIVESDFYSPEVELSEIEKTIESLDPEWDVFFPFDKFEDKEHCGTKLTSLNVNLKEVNDRDPFFWGLFWGSSIYFVSKRGVTKLLEINTIRQRIDDEIFMMSSIGKLNSYFCKTDWVKSEYVKDNCFEERNLEICQAIFEINAWTDKNKMLARLLLKIVSEKAENLKIDLVLQGGTHLSFIRHGYLMPWDDDIDIGIQENDILRFLAKFENSNIDFAEFVEDHTQTKFYKLWLKQGEIIEGFPYKFPFIDLWLFNKTESDFIFKNGIICPNANLMPLRTVQLEEANFKIPHNSTECLDARYKDWRTHIRVYSYSHRYEMVKFPALKAKISVDVDGRMVSPLINYNFATSHK